MVAGFLSVWHVDATPLAGLVQGLPGQELPADKAYDRDAIVQEAMGKCMDVVIPPKANRKKKRAWRHEMASLTSTTRPTCRFLKSFSTLTPAHHAALEGCCSRAHVPTAYTYRT